MTIHKRLTTKPGYKILLVLAAFGIAGNYDYKDQLMVHQVAAKAQVIEDRQANLEKKISVFMERENSPNSQEFARAIAKHKRPRLLAAVAAVESNGNPSARGKAGEIGAYQVTPKHWGAVPKDIAGQTDQAAKILEELLEANSGRIKPALSAYNGDTTGRYADKVMAKASQL